ncbi:hypothetical protein [uncultured Desulfosarcina sp.]|uniref:hypothetical protein n=1 Tax=uncultured Desulfosarcina sp. TaxID=218289 RepID=UPI0029C8AB79|nr:hypothetical protein [uncultured Desulfosarcina sp.]
MLEGLWTIICVFIGYGLNEITQWGKEKRLNNTLRNSLMEELKTIVRLITSRRGVIKQALKALEDTNIMNTSCTHFPDHIYRRILEVAPNLLSNAEKDCLHLLYERLRIADQT